jgi:hypothetical protein
MENLILHITQPSREPTQVQKQIRMEKNSNVMLTLFMYVTIRSPSRYTMGTIPLKIFLVSLSPIHSQNMESNGGVRQLDRFPRKSKM